MFIVLLKFSDNKAKASQFMKGHGEWIDPGDHPVEGRRTAEFLA